MSDKYEISYSCEIIHILGVVFEFESLGPDSAQTNRGVEAIEDGKRHGNVGYDGPNQIARIEIILEEKSDETCH